MKKVKLTSRIHIVEILHVDTANSRSLYTKLKANSQDKCYCQELLRDLFEQCCEENGGVLRYWAGDGGHAFFPCAESAGASIQAATMFLQQLPVVNAQSAQRLEVRTFYRSVRIKTHRGEVFLSDDAGLDSADPKDFDDFLKAEKKFAPKVDELFVTGALFDSLSAKDKKKFELYLKRVNAGDILTPLLRIKKQPRSTSIDIFEHGDQLSEISQSEWEYLRTQICSSKRNVAARNLITTGLIAAVERATSKKAKSQICEKYMAELTIKSLYNYLRITFERNRFRVSYWRCVEQRKKAYLIRQFYQYPDDEETSVRKRKVKLDDQKYQVCRAFKAIKPIVTPSVVGDRHAGKWVDFDDGQKKTKRALASAITDSSILSRCG